jgi:hypothetical protein
MVFTVWQPAPESFEARAMPAKDGLRLNHLGHAEQARPEPGHPYQHRPVTAAQSKTRRRTPQGDAELMTEKQVLRVFFRGEHADRTTRRRWNGIGEHDAKVRAAISPGSGCSPDSRCGSRGMPQSMQRAACFVFSSSRSGRTNSRQCWMRSSTGS